MPRGGAGRLRSFLLPGLGWAVIRLPDRGHEVEDIKDVGEQALAELRLAGD
jgi:hypothetical protein